MRVRKLLIILLLLASLCVSGYTYAIWWGSGPSYAPIAVQIPKGVSLRAAAAKLETAGVICCSERFYRLAQIFGSSDPIRAGEFMFPAAVSPAQVLDILQHGTPVQRLITIPEGMPSILVHEKLIAEPRLTGTIKVPVEGSVLPDSYSFERGETRAAVLKRMQDAMKSTLGELWKARKKTTPVKSSREAIILASIVEKETGKPEERRMVAGVYANRLRIGMALQARSEKHKPEIQSLMRNSDAVFCLKKQNQPRRR